MTIHCTTVTTEANEIDPPLRVMLTGIDTDEVLAQVDITDVIAYFGAHALLKQIEYSDIKTYMED